ncbi:hypothetical protein D3C76_1796740 [compost metagenome]
MLKVHVQHLRHFSDDDIFLHNLQPARFHLGQIQNIIDQLKQILSRLINDRPVIRRVIPVRSLVSTLAFGDNLGQIDDSI